MEQLATPSKWDTPFKGRYGNTLNLNASACKQALRYTKFLDAAYLAELADLGQPVPRCQDVPAWAVVTLQEMEESGMPEWMLSALIISYPWLDADHPDIDGAQLRRLAFVLKAFANKAGEKEGGKCGVFWDYCSCAAASIAPAPTSSACRLSPALALSHVQAAAALHGGPPQGQGERGGGAGGGRGGGRGPGGAGQGGQGGVQGRRRPHAGGAEDVRAGAASAVDIEPQTTAAAAFAKGSRPTSRRRRASRR